MPTEAELAQAIADRMRPLRAHYLDKLRTRMPMMERAVLMLLSNEFTQASDRQALQIEAHKLAGNGATYGFPAISTAARALENALPPEAETDDQALLKLVADLLHVCHEALAEGTPEAGHAALESTRHEAQAQHHPAVLVADDDEAVRELVERKLGHAGCKVVCAEDGAQAWQMLQTQRFALAVLDLMMPGYDGMTLLRMMQNHAQTAHTPVVFLTAKGLSSDVLAGLNTGAADYITKPFNANELVTRCKRLLLPSGRRSDRTTATRRRDESTAGCR